MCIAVAINILPAQYPMKNLSFIFITFPIVALSLSGPGESTFLEKAQLHFGHCFTWSNQ